MIRLHKFSTYKSRFCLSRLSGAREENGIIKIWLWSENNFDLFLNVGADIVITDT